MAVFTACGPERAAANSQSYAIISAKGWDPWGAKPPIHGVLEHQFSSLKISSPNPIQTDNLYMNEINARYQSNRNRSKKKNILLSESCISEILKWMFDCSAFWESDVQTCASSHAGPTGGDLQSAKKWIINCNIEGIDTHTHTGINTCIVCVLRAMFDVTGIRYQTYWFSFNVWWHWWWKSDDDDVICFYLSSVECCTGMLWQCVDSPVFYNRTVWDEPRKAKRNVLGLSSCFFYVLYIEIHFFQIKWLLVSKSLFSETTHTRTRLV